jgi:hypothetical protein
VQYRTAFFMLRIMTDYWVARGFIFFTEVRLPFVMTFSFFQLLESPSGFRLFICLEFSKFSTQDKVPTHFEGDSRTIIAGRFLKPYRSKDLS